MTIPLALGILSMPSTALAGPAACGTPRPEILAHVAWQTTIAVHPHLLTFQCTTSLFGLTI